MSLKPYRKSLIYVLLLPNFQRTFRRFQPPVFKRAAKKQPFYISTKFFWYFIEAFYLVSNPDYLKNYLKNYPVFQAECKGKGRGYSCQILLPFYCLLIAFYFFLTLQMLFRQLFSGIYLSGLL